LGKASPDSGQMVCAWKGESEMVMIRTHAKGCTPLTANFFAKHTFARELLPCCFMESFRWIFYNKDEEMSEGGGAR